MVTLAFGLMSIAALGLLGACQDAKKDDASGAKKLVFATDATWPPMEFVTDSGDLVGFDIDMVKAMAKAGGFEVEFKIVSWDGIFAGLENGQYNAISSSVTINEERSATYDFSAPYVQAGQVLLVPSSADDSITLEALSGKDVGAQIGTAGAMEVQKYPDINLKEYSEVGLAIQDMVNGNISGVVLDSPVAIDYALQNANFKGKVKLAGALLTAEDLGLVVKKGDAETLDLLNKALAAIEADGTLASIKKTWGLQ